MEGKRPRLPADILDVVFSWSLDDIFNDELYADKVKEIPLTFQSVGQYMGSFMYPLLEETRVALRESMGAIGDAPFAEIVAVKEAEPFGEKSYDVKVQPWRNESFSCGNEIYKPSPGDVFLLTNVRPAGPSDLYQNGGTYMLSSISGVENDGDSLTDFRLRASKTIGVSDGMDRPLFAVFLLNITASSHIWRALGTGDINAGNLDIIREILCNDASVSNVGGVCDICSHEDLNDDWASRCPELNSLQVQAICASVREMHCDHRSSVKLIWGPPGTGKTKVISELLGLLFTMNCKVLTCTSSCITVLEVASQLLNFIKRNCWKGTVDESSFCPLGDIILLGKRNHLKVADDSNICDIFLDNRVERLEECLAPLGWGHCITSMIEFLEDCISQYGINVEDGKCKQNQETEDEKTKEHEENKGTTTFLHFVEKRFVTIASSIRRFAAYMCTHLPSNIVSGHNFDSMMSLLNLLENFESLLSQADAVGSELEEIFSTSDDASDLTFPEMDEGGHNMCPLSILLRRTRRRCLHILRSLQHSFNLPRCSDRKGIRDLCLHSASIILCTTCYSFELLGKKPFNFLIIDEASQLKECESVIPLQLLGIRHAILLGDESQLPATIKSKIAEEAKFPRSLFERLSSLGHPRHMLRLQYRMHPSISSFPNDYFYSGQLLDSPKVKCKSYEKRYIPGRMYGPYSFINVADGREEFDDCRKNLKNMVEVAVVVQIVQRVFKARNAVKEKINIGIISPYRAQVAAIHEKLSRYYDIDKDIAVEVRSVDGFQGSEEDIIIISTVRSNVDESVGFHLSPQRLNVALTRARHCLWIIGNAETLIRSYSFWETLVQNAKDRGCFFNADEDRILAKTILNVKNELNEIGDLLKEDSVLFRTARWKVLFSEFFKKSLGKIQSIQLRKTVITFLLKLASGWRPKKYIDVAYEDPLKLVKQYRVKGFIIVCTIDIMKYSEYIQVLKIWDILPSSDVPILVDRLSAFLKAYDYIDYCKMKHFEGKLEVPISWKNGFDIVQYRSHRRYMVARDPQDDPLDGRNYAENSKVSESLSVMKFYSLSSGVVHHLISGLDGKELDLPFELTDQEREIIRFPKSTFILGRSGTGKTTVLTVKLIQREQQHSLSVEGLCNLESYSSQGPNRKNKVNENAADTNKNKLRQLFVTVSPMLCSAIKNYVCRLKRFSLGGDFFADNDSDGMYDVDGGVMEPADISDSFVDVPSEKYPLVITFRKFLMMLDGSLTNSFFTRFYELKELPLNEKGYSFSPAFRSFIRQKEVNFERFTMVYWPHFNKQLTRKLDSSRVFKEIISHIKGGCAISEDCDGVLSRENYTILSEGRTSTINGEMRELIFDIFLDYEKMKLRRGDFDISDWVINLHRRLRAAGAHLGDKMDFVYVDEVQDLTLQQVALFKYVCNNLSDGFLFAGDTAQTVAKGIDFRFEDIKSMYYTEYLLKPSVGSSDKEKGKGKYISDLFHLTQNFRTHTGVLNLAQSVVKILYHYFPQSIDHLDPETSLIHGEAPVLIECGDDENAITTIFGGYGGDGNCNIAKCFGAEQVILVRDEASRKEISGCVGKQALVLTIIECKGLEFQDVLLYNFFGSSPLKGQWRVILDYMHSHKLLGSGHAKSFPGFEMTRHNVLCSELKQLYVAITRTRQRLWICESNTEYSKPMFEYWKSLSMVHATKLDGSIVHSMQVVSSKDEWRNRGYKLYKEGNFEQATFCFERAEDKYGEKCAYAAGLQDSAYRMLPMNSDKAQSSLIEAAEIYLTIGKPEEAAECYVGAKAFQKAATIYLEKCGDSRCEDAGYFFSLARCWSLAAEAYAKGNKFDKCLSACTKGKLFEKGWSFILHWKESATPDAVATCGHKLDEISDAFLVESVLHYHKVKDKHNMLKFFRALQNMEHAGNCFYQKMCWSLAAEAYAKAKKLSNCLSACVKGLLVERGLSFIEHWKDNATSNDVTASSQNLVAMKDSFLERCISHYHEIKNKDSMLKFVKAFSSVEYARTFLRTRDYLEELFLVEEELGNFSQAANVAKLKGDLLLEANMLAKAENFEEASRLILFHVVVNSLWTSGSKGWPLKQFKGKNELLKRAELLAQKCSSCFCESVCIESDILSDNDHILSHLVKRMNSGLENRSIRAEIFSARKLLDLHFQLGPCKYSWVADIKSTSENNAEAILLKNVMSYETLFYIWNFYKGKILNVLVYLNLDGEQIENDYLSYGDFCLEYLGVRKQRDGRYTLLTSEASWTNVLDPRLLSWVRGHISIGAQDFVSAARSYWDLETVAVGMKVLKTLNELREFCLENVDCPFSQGNVLLYIYQVSKFLLESELVNSKVHSGTLRSFLDLSKAGYFDIAFPLDWKETATWSMFSLWQQDLAVEVLKETLAANLNMKSGMLTHGQVGRVVMLLLSCGMPGETLYPRLRNCFNVSFPQWRTFLEALEQDKYPEKQVSLIMSLQAALYDTFNINWQEEVDYISPHCFLYLVEHILYLASACQQYCFTTKSTLMRAIIPPECETNFHDLLMKHACPQGHLTETFDFVAHIVQDILSDGHTIVQWIRSSKADADHCYPLLVMRMVIMIGLVHLNSGDGCHLDLLLEVLRFKHVASELPQTFHACLQMAGKYNFCAVFSCALELVGDPLVILSFEKGLSKQTSPDSVFINLGAVGSRRDILDILMPSRHKNQSNGNICKGK